MQDAKEGSECERGRKDEGGGDGRKRGDFLRKANECEKMPP
jgi:hypothetical protein